MSDTIDDARMYLSEQRHERGLCEIGCPFCPDPDEGQHGNVPMTPPPAPEESR